jgi:hypothetical protein
LGDHGGVNGVAGVGGPEGFAFVFEEKLDEFDAGGAFGDVAWFAVDAGVEGGGSRIGTAGPSGVDDVAGGDEDSVGAAGCGGERDFDEEAGGELFGEVGEAVRGGGVEEDDGFFDDFGVDGEGGLGAEGEGEE